ncbi:MAG: KH domain-containing protein [Candidatus Micrarchaeia archaeon]
MKTKKADFMQRVLIPEEKIKVILKNPEIIKKVEDSCRCRIEISEEGIEITGNSFDEFSAKNIIFAFGRGFTIDEALMLLNDNFYFSIIDLEQYFGSENRIHQVKARIIGENGKVKKNIENVSKAKISVYGNTVSFIGTQESINEAETCVNALIDGESHRSAYRKMEAAHRKNRQAYREIGMY